MIKSYCSECEAQSIDGVMKHAKDCTASQFAPISSTDYIRMPGITIKFDNPEEQAEWLRNLNGSSGEHKTLHKLAQRPSNRQDTK